MHRKAGLYARPCFIRSLQDIGATASAQNRNRFLESTMPRFKNLERPLCVRMDARRSSSSSGYPSRTGNLKSLRSFFRKSGFKGLRVTTFLHISPLTPTTGAHRLAVRTAPFHGADRGSIPLGRTTFWSISLTIQSVSKPDGFLSLRAIYCAKIKKPACISIFC